MLDFRHQRHSRSRTQSVGTGTPRSRLHARFALSDRDIVRQSAESLTSPVPSVTLCICTRNGALRLPALFTALACQTLPFHEWEVLVLDLASTDDTAEVARRHILAKLGGRGRVLRVAVPGLAWTRARAAREARGDILCFLDDHHHPAPDFLAAVRQAFATRPRAGVIGGKVLPGWETPPTALAATVAPFALGIGDLGETSQCLEPGDRRLPGAGLSFRRRLLLRLVGAPAPVLKQFSATNLLSAGDLALTLAARQRGWQCWYDATLTVHHVLPAASQDKTSLLRCYEEIGRRQAALRPLAWVCGLLDYCRWHVRQWRGPAPELRLQHPALAHDLHDLQQKLLHARARQALSGPTVR